MTISVQKYPVEIEFLRESDNWPDGLDLKSQTAVEHALAKASVEIEGPLELSILLTSDTAQQEINRKWRGKDKSTNVLSFPQFEPFSPIFGLFGDISFAYETVQREAIDLGKSFEDHFTHLIVHGTLHLVGYDHETDEQALEMESLETEILRDLGLPNPYEQD